MGEEERQELTEAEEICRRFLAWDPMLTSGINRSRPVKGDLAVMLGRDL